MSDYPGGKYWKDALWSQIAERWGSERIFAAEQDAPTNGALLQIRDDQLEDLCYSRAITSFMDVSPLYLENRKRLLFHYMLGPFDGDRDSLLGELAHTLPVQTFIPKIVNARCIAYNGAPVRTLKREGKDDDKATENMRTLYLQAGADGRLQIAHRYAYALGGVFVRPYVGITGRMAFEITTPDLCRFDTHPQFPDKLTRFIKSLDIADNDGKRTHIFEVWTDELYRYLDAKGMPMEYEADNGTAIPKAGIPNPYGRIPWVLLRLVEPNDNATFGGGLFTAVEGNIEANKVAFMGSVSATYESFGTWVAKNLNLKGVRVRFGFGTIVDADNVSDEQQPPELDFVSGNGQYANLGQYKQDYVKQIMRDLDLPESVIDSLPGGASGISRMLERLALLEQRRADVLMLGPFEAALYTMFATVYNINVVDENVRGAVALPVDAELSIVYAEEKILDEPEKLYANAKQQFTDGVIGPQRFLADAAGIIKGSDEEAVEYMADNLEMIKDLMPSLVPPEPVEEAEETPEATPEPPEIDEGNRIATVNGNGVMR